MPHAGAPRNIKHILGAGNGMEARLQADSDKQDLLQAIQQMTLVFSI